ncbi:RibD family protein [Microbacterium aurantiacum]|uniref:RibD family protein n=1 Tax=Microbacterium aurantiacum TaxID=162393 RepID=UPI00287B6396|nr:RibD family protein [Microbacterium aurantiacum]
MPPTTAGGPTPSSASGGAPDPDDRAWRQLLAGDEPACAQLAEIYTPLVEARGPFAVAQLGQSLDGFIAARTGDACYVTGEEDRRHLHRLRALVDAVVVGWRTVANDDPRLTVRAVAGPNPVRVVLDASARIPAASVLLHDGAAPTLWLVDAETPVETQVGPHVQIVCVPELRSLTPREILAVLEARGLSRVLIEGGGVTVSRFVGDHALRWLYLTTAPVLIGDGVPGIRFDGEDRLADALRGPVRRFPLGADLCTEFTF